MQIEIALLKNFPEKITKENIANVIDFLSIRGYRQTIYKNYFVNESGHVVNLSLSRNSKAICEKYLDKDGYQRIWINEGFGKRKFVPVHRLVAMTFIDLVDNKNIVNHKDGNKLNNRIENLEWCTVLENERHSRNVLGKKNVVGVASGRSKLTEKQVIEIRNSDLSYKDICNKYSISDTQARRIKNRTNWGHIQ
jgi:hypothetical protein